MATFEAFRRVFGGLRDSMAAPNGPWLDERLCSVKGYIDFSAEFAGASFGDGLYRVHDGRSGQSAIEQVAASFPDYASRFHPFGYDWLGRQFGIDVQRLQGSDPQVLLLEPGTGEALEIPATFASFHDVELIEYPDAALAADFFSNWAAFSGESLPLGRDKCVGYRVPLFLGGVDDLDNLETVDLDVYWSICGQLRLGTMQLPPGTSIDEISE